MSGTSERSYYSDESDDYCDSPPSSEDQFGTDEEKYKNPDYWVWLEEKRKLEEYNESEYQKYLDEKFKEEEEDEKDLLTAYLILEIFN
jgi:hypothetical protein